MKPFTITCIEPEQNTEDAVEVKIDGFLDAHTVVSFEKTLHELIDRDYVKFIIDLSELNYISSAGIGALMVLLQQLRRRNGDMVIVNPAPKVLKILDLLGFTKIFQIRENLETAKQLLS